MSGDVFHDVEIRGNDSIFVFIECLLPATEGNDPYLVDDAIEFLTNGVSQEVRLEAYGQNVTRLRGVTVDKDMRLTTERPYIVFDTLTIAEGARLTVDRGEDAFPRRSTSEG